MVKELKKKSRQRKKSALAKLLTVALFRCHTTEKNQQKALNKSFLQKRRKITNSEKKKFFSKSRHFLKKRRTFASDKPSEMCLRRNHFYLAEKERERDIRKSSHGLKQEISRAIEFDVK